MLTIQLLKEFGANTAEGLGRCMNNETFYLRLVGMGLADAGFEKLLAAAWADDRQAAFEAAHALKGVLGNLALTPLYTSASEITELLRSGRDADYAAMAEALIEKRDALKKAAE